MPKGHPESSGPKKMVRPPVTRYGPIKGSPSKFLTEERFAWQKAKFQSDVVYDLPSATMTRSVVFSSGLRSGMDDNPDAKKRSTGPGSYNTGPCYDKCSNWLVHHAARFGAAPRESMAIKTPSPGAVYNIEKTYYTGPDKGKAISFNCDQRKPLYNGGNTDADMLWPSLPKGPSITFGKRISVKEKGSDTPGAVYSYNMKSNAPSFSFGRGKGDRFAQVGFLTEKFDD